MSKTTKISWCDSTINRWTVCDEVSAGCGHCFARELAKRYGWGRGWGKGVPRHPFKNAMKNLAALNRSPWVCDECGNGIGSDGDCECGQVGAIGHKHRRRIFHGDLCDIFDPEAPLQWLAEWLDGIHKATECVHILCTKRLELWPQHMDTLRRLTWVQCRAWVDRWYNGEAPANIILLASVENQEQADKRIPQLLSIPAACRGLSLEPLLGPVDLHFDTYAGKRWAKESLHWLIVGGESGRNARPCDVKWIRSLVAQGNAAGVATFVKQLGSFHVDVDRSDEPEDWAKELNHPKGGNPSEWPTDLRVQEWPKGF